MGWKKSLRKSLFVFLSFALIASWASAWGTGSARAADSSFGPLGQPTEQVFEGTQVEFDDNDDGISYDAGEFVPVPIGFDFDFYGATHSSVYATTNGLLMFEYPSDRCCAAGDTLPIGNPDHYITAFYDDLYMGPDSKVLYRTIGEIGDRKFIIQYTNMRTYWNRDNESFGTFQVILYERDNEIQFQYPSLADLPIYGDTAFGSNALIGVQSPDGDYSIYSQKEKSLTEKQAIRFTHDTDSPGLYALPVPGNYEPILLTHSIDTGASMNQPVDIVAIGTELSDPATWENGKSEAIPFGQDFKFKLYGHEVDSVYATTNGMLYLGNGGIITPHFGLSLTKNSRVLHATLGTAPNRKLVVQFTNLIANDVPVGTTQVIFSETTNEIQFQYPYLVSLDPSNGDLPFGSGAVIGIQWYGAGGGGTTYSYYKKSLTEKQAIRFTPVTAEQLEYTITREAQYEPTLLIPDSFPAQPTPVSPADGATSSAMVDFAWTGAGAGAGGYLLLVSADRHFYADTIVLQEELGDENTFSLTDVSLLEEGTRYYWKIVSFNDNGLTFSNTYSFYVFSNPPASVVTGSASSITSLTATVGGSVTPNGNASIQERGIVYSLNANPTISDLKAAAATNGAGAYTVSLSGLQADSNYHARAYATSDGYILYGQDISFRTLGSNASLSALSLSGITLNESVSSGVYAYTASVPNSVSSTRVTATVSEAVYGSIQTSVYNAANTLTYGPVSLASGQTSGDLPLNVGANRIEVIVLAGDGSGTTYNVTVTRAAAPIVNNTSGGGGGVNTVTSKNGKITVPVGSAGEVSLDGDIEIKIPAKASSKQLELTIEKLLSTQGLLGNKEILASAVYEVLKNFPENFGKPVTLSLKFDASKVKSGQTVAIFYFDEAKKVWVKVEGGRIQGDRISAEVDHFTKFAVLVVDEKTGKPVAEQSTTVETPETTIDVKLGDIAGHWAEASIKDAVKKGIVKGYTDGTFKPNATVTRAEFAVMLINALKPAGTGAELRFADNAKIGGWAREAIAQAVQASIIKGFSDGTFRPNAELTRAEMASIVANALKLTAEKGATTSFSDDKSIPAWAKGAIAELTKLGIMQGKSGNKFDAVATATRAEAVTVLLKMLAQAGK
ncbi:S-layer homology domain-containing protein [Cohnella terricola]|uniref:SLH domain-containing protein n=1 Tax=Cohnella terricola TaxID=1289167 RepID=A0A559JMQ7_9BACL|nr:S-layer homology domain-containing protein [Cohnella terricola]TVY01150.1 hypothetical protein FPZ45_08320 [Cohnella terricola]